MKAGKLNVLLLAGGGLGVLIGIAVMLAGIIAFFMVHTLRSQFAIVGGLVITLIAFVCVVAGMHDIYR